MEERTKVNGMERLARAERDCVELHSALTEAVRRLKMVDDAFGGRNESSARYDDLLEVLARTARVREEPSRG